MKKGTLCGVSTSDILWILSFSKDYRPYILEEMFVRLFIKLSLSQVDFFMGYKAINLSEASFVSVYLYPNPRDLYASYKHLRESREAARNASIALIGAGRQRKHKPGALDAIRVIARAVWGLRLIGGESPRIRFEEKRGLK
jgi:hypothetical protein